VHQVVDNLLFAPGHAILTLSMLVLLMAQRDGTLTWLSVVLAPFMVGASFLLGRPLRMAARMKRDIDAKWQSHLQQTLTGIPVVQAFVQEDREQARFQAFADAALRVQHRSVFLGSLNSLGSGLITVAGTGVILWAGAQAVVAERITVGDLLLFLIYLGLLQAQVRTLANVYPTLQGLGGSVDRVMEVLESEPEIAEAANARPLTRARGAVGFEGVTFGYEAGRPVLREITVSVQPGETWAIVGPTGAGKSTLAGLVPRFYDPWSGRVTLDGRDLRELRLGDVRDQVSLVMQEAFLFPMPVWENIGMGRPSVSRSLHVPLGKIVGCRSRTGTAASKSNCLWE
jgi:ABC-type multidrug transport system fused ATPase/permease subunit